MSEDNLQKFVENMRAAGQSDEMIMQSLLSAGHNELIVLNLLDKAHFDDLEVDEASEPSNATDAMLPILDVNGNVLIDPSNPPIPLEEEKRIQQAMSEDDQSATPPMSSQTQPKTTPDITHSATVHTTPQYGHRSYSVFFKQVTDHKEIDAGNDHALSASTNNANSTPADSYNEASEIPAPIVSTETEAHSSPGSLSDTAIDTIDELLETQKEEANAEPTGPKINDLLDEKDLEAFASTDTLVPAPGAINLNSIPETPEITNLGSNVSFLRNSLALKVVGILFCVTILVGLAFKVMMDIKGS